MLAQSQPGFAADDGWAGFWRLEQKSEQDNSVFVLWVSSSGRLHLYDSEWKDLRLASDSGLEGETLMLSQFFGGEDTIVRRVTVSGESRYIVGVVANIAQRRLSGLQALNAAIYFPMAQRPLRGLWIVLRAAGDPHALAAATQTAVWAVDADQPINAIQTMNEHMSSALAGPNLLTQILFVVGGLALGLAAIGIYGVMAYSVSQQTNEIGIRMALGAKPGQILTGVTRQGIKLAALGLVLGAPAAALVVVFISRIFQTGDISGVGGIAATPIVLVSATLATVALVACILPARRATKIDPVVALQQE